MEKVSVVGCGLMGSAISMAFLKGGNRVLVYDIIKEKCSTLVENGADLAESPFEAADRSDVMVVSIPDYKGTMAFIDENNLLQSLEGKTMVQLSSGTPQEARTLNQMAKNENVNYLDGAILAYPEQMGTEAATVVFSGSPEAFDKNQELLKCLTPSCIFLGEEIGLASGIDMATLIFGNGVYSSFFLGAALCLSEKIPFKQYLEFSLAPIIPTIFSDFQTKLAKMETNNYDEAESTVQTWFKVTTRIIAALESRNLNAKIEKEILAIMQRAISAGYGEKDHAVLFEMMKQTS